MFACYKTIIRSKCEICSQLTKKFVIDVVLASSFLFFEQFSHIVLVLQLLTLNKTSPNTNLLSIQFATIKIRVAIRFAEDGTRIGGIKFELFHSLIQIILYITVEVLKSHINTYQNRPSSK